MEDREIVDGICMIISSLVYHQSVQERLTDQLVIVADNEFKYFARYGLPVNARNVLNDNTKISQNLWYEKQYLQIHCFIA